MQPGRLVHAEEDQWQVFLPLNPVAAARPRVGRWGTYYPKTYQEWKEAADALLADVMPLEPLVTETVFVTVSSVLHRPNKPANPWPVPDVDNFAKGALDAITKAKILWEDDKQVQALITGKRYADLDEDPHTVVQVGLTPALGLDPALLWVSPSFGFDVLDLPSEDRTAI